VLLTIREVARELRVHPRTVKRWIKAGNLQAVKLSAGIIRVDSEEVARLRTTGIKVKEVKDEES